MLLYSFVFVVGLDLVYDGVSPIALDTAPRDIPAGPEFVGVIINRICHY